MYSEPRLRPVPLNATAQAAAMLTTPGSTAASTLRIGMIGLGTVGMGTWTVLQRNQALIEARCGKRLDITAVAVRDTARARAALGDEALRKLELCNDPLYVAAHPDVDVVVEVVGGTGDAREWVLAALNAGKHVVTANKALLAVHGEELAAIAMERGCQLAYEAAVAGAVPIIKTLREGLAGNQIQSVVGILNGTSNYILTRMSDAGLSFAQALAEAQQLGYAEADPTFDVDGIDAAHKLSLLAANAFGMPVPFDSVQVHGIRDLHACDIAAAAELGYAVKLLAVAKRVDAQSVELHVRPSLVSLRHQLAHVNGANNAIVVEGDACGTAFYSGAGAGAEPTASAVVADLVDLARLPRPVLPGTSGAASGVPILGPRRCSEASTPSVVPADAVVSRHMLHIVQEAGLCETSAVRLLRKFGLHVERRKWCLHDQTGEAESCAPSLVLITAPASHATVREALRSLSEQTGVSARSLCVFDSP